MIPPTWKRQWNGKHGFSKSDANVWMKHFAWEHELVCHTFITVGCLPFDAFAAWGILSQQKCVKPQPNGGFNSNACIPNKFMHWAEPAANASPPIGILRVTRRSSSGLAMLPIQLRAWLTTSIPWEPITQKSNHGVWWLVRFNMSPQNLASGASTCWS